MPHKNSKTYRTGETSTSTCGLRMRIIDYIASTYIIVQFEDGTEVASDYEQFKKADVGHPLFKNMRLHSREIWGLEVFRVGEKYRTPDGELLTARELMDRAGIEKVF